MFAGLWIKNWACRVSDFLQFDLWERVLGAAFRLRAELPPNIAPKQIKVVVVSCSMFVWSKVGDWVHRSAMFFKVDKLFVPWLGDARSQSHEMFSTK